MLFYTNYIKWTHNGEGQLGKGVKMKCFRMQSIDMLFDEYNCSQYWDELPLITNNVNM